MERAITQDPRTGNIYIKFGGKLLIQLGQVVNRKTCVLSIQENAKTEDVGKILSGSEVDIISPQIILMFDNPKPIDILIKNLQTLKESLCTTK